MQPTPTIIESGHSGRGYWRDLYRYRELFYLLVWRDFLVRYRQTALGVAWAVIKPTATMAILTLVFGKVAKLSSGDLPYPLLVYAGILPWQMFSSAVSDSGSSLVNNVNLVSKVYFPRALIPAATTAISVIDFVVCLFLTALLMLWYQVVPPIQVIFLPLFAGLIFMASLGTALWCSALIVLYRDFRFVLPFALQLGMFLSPVGFSSATVPEEWQWLYYLNPLASLIDGFRWCLFGGSHTLWLPGLAIACGVTALVTYTGLRFFRRAERVFADII